jgi:hypothetical protein
MVHISDESILGFQFRYDFNTIWTKYRDIDIDVSTICYSIDINISLYRLYVDITIY